jgi:hypothetical protein
MAPVDILTNPVYYRRIEPDERRRHWDALRTVRWIGVLYRTFASAYFP